MHLEGLSPSEWLVCSNFGVSVEQHIYLSHNCCSFASHFNILLLYGHSVCFLMFIFTRNMASFKWIT